MVGARSAKAILAINTDRDAPMVTRATYAVIGDLHTVLPAIIAAVRGGSLGPARPVSDPLRATSVARLQRSWKFELGNLGRMISSPRWS